MAARSKPQPAAPVEQPPAENKGNNPGYGLLYPAKKRENGPVMSGTFADPDGNPFEIAAWRKTGKSGTVYLSLKIEPPWNGDEGDMPF